MSPTLSRLTGVVRRPGDVSDGWRVDVRLRSRADLVPKEVAQAWLKYLREELPTVAFKCSTQKGSVSTRSGSSETFDGSSADCLGAETLLQVRVVVELVARALRAPLSLHCTHSFVSALPSHPAIAYPCSPGRYPLLGCHVVKPELLARHTRRLPKLT